MRIVLPPLLLGILIAGYWARVLRMAYKARRRSGRAANLVPGERLGRWLRMVWTPIIGVWVVLPFVVAASRRLPALVRPIFYNNWIAWPALAVALVALVLTVRCWRAMGRHWRMGIDPNEQNVLIAAGPFARVRHPIYALSIVLMLATMCMIPSPLMLVAGVMHIALLAWEARREERHLLAIHRQAYADYCSRTGMFLPQG